MNHDAKDGPLRPEFEERCIALVTELGLGGPNDVLAARPLTGGVASDIAAITLPDREICVKFALPQLRVTEEWKAPISRNRAEYAWLKFAGKIAPLSVPMLYGCSERLHGFAMELVMGDNVYLWKTALLRGASGQGEAAKVADMLGRIHAASAAAGFNREHFENRDDFQALRIEPYLLFTATRHRAASEALHRLADALDAADAVLVHGDVSPKNILFRNGAPVILDAECATMGDPCFDVAFCLNHLILKAFHLPTGQAWLVNEVRFFWAAYAPHVHWEDVAGLQARVAALLPALMLARVDGRSPIEYLSEDMCDKLREATPPLISNPPATIAGLISALFEES